MPRQNKPGEETIYAAALSDQSVERLEKAIKLHERHLAIADAGGSFAAFTNLGLCRGALGDADGAARHHQDALRLAIELESSSGQSIAVGNLGSLAMRRGDLATLRGPASSSTSSSRGRWATPAPRSTRI